MDKISIFVSCGQRTPEEISLGKRIKEVIDAEPGFIAYYAETVQNLASLNSDVYAALSRCSGVVIILHKRGIFTDNDRNPTPTSSIWINQEIAILSYRQFYESREIPILAFKEVSVNLSGAMTFMILNPRPINSEEDVVAEVKTWLKSESFGSGNTDIFEEKWSAITDEQRKFLVCLIDEGATDIKEEAIRKRLMKDFKLENNNASSVISNAKLRLTEIGFVTYNRNIITGHEFSLHDSWAFMVRRKIMGWNRSSTS